MDMMNEKLKWLEIKMTRNKINKNDDKTKMMRHKTDLETKKMIKVKNDKLKMIKLKMI